MFTVLTLFRLEHWYLILNLRISRLAVPLHASRLDLSRQPFIWVTYLAIVLATRSSSFFSCLLLAHPLAVPRVQCWWYWLQRLWMRSEVLLAWGEGALGVAVVNELARIFHSIINIRLVWWCFCDQYSGTLTAHTLNVRDLTEALCRPFCCERWCYMIAHR